MAISREIEELNIADARKELTKLPDRLAAQPITVSVKRRGKPVLAIMAWEDYEAIVETLEILGDAEAVEELRKSLSELREGKVIAWDEAKVSL